MDVALDQLPIPDWGLVCPRCRYPLKGLPQHRCPECGLQFDIAALIRSWTRLRDPLFTGRELPLPDYGLTCRACGGPLAGAERFECPSCAAPFDPQAWQPATAWFTFDRDLCGDLPIPGVQALLAAENVPHVPVMEKSLSEIYGGQSMMVERLRAPSEFYFEICWLVRRAQERFKAARATGKGASWRCEQCGEENPAHFEICWNCGETEGLENIE